MVDFTKYLGGTVGKVLTPIVLPSATYPGVVKAYELGTTQPKLPENPDGTPYLRYSYTITGWPDHIAEEQRYHKDADGNEVPIDLAKFAGRFYSDFWLTDEAKFMLHEFWDTCGVEKGISEQEAMALPQGASVLLGITQLVSTVDPNKPRVYNPKRINAVTGTARR